MNAEPVTERRFARRLAAVMAVCGLLLTAACAAGQVAQTADQKPSIDGTEADVGDIHLRGLAILPPSAVFYPTGSNARVRVVVVNSSDRADTLTSITSPRITTWASFNNSLAATANIGGVRSVRIPPGARVSYSVPETRSILLLRGFKTRTFPGTTIPLTFTFARAGAVTVATPIQLHHPPGSSVVPGPSATGQDR